MLTPEKQLTESRHEGILLHSDSDGGTICRSAESARCATQERLQLLAFALSLPYRSR